MSEWESRLREVLRNQADGLGSAELRLALADDSITPQALQRALRKLEAAGQVRFTGNTKARRYFAVDDAPRSDERGTAFPLSAEAHEVLALVSGPPASRKPVSYQRAFLDGYVPQETRWLPVATTERLHALGRTPQVSEPAGTYARQVLERFLLDLSWNSSRLEGNTYSLLDTERLLAAGKQVEGKGAVETQMLLNHKAAIEFLVGTPGAPAPLDERTLKALHALLMENLLGNSLDEGRLRATPVHIGGSVYLPLANPQVLDECFRQLVVTAQHIDDPFERSFFLFVQLPYLQPFIDGNKRVARLAANVPFIERNLVPLSFVDVPRDLYQRATLASYELNRLEPLRDLFTWAYERSVARLGQVRASLGEPDSFRLEHRAALRQVIGELVRGQVRPTKRRAALERFASRHVAAKARARFIALAELELEGLNEVTAARYGFRPSELAAWRRLK